MSPATDAVPRLDRPGVPSSAIPMALLLGGIALLFTLVSGFGTNDVRTRIVAWSLAVVVLTVAAQVLVNALPDNAHAFARWRLGPWFLLWAGCGYGVASLTWIGPQTGSAGWRISQSSIPIALTIVSAALIAWTAGYLAGPPRAIRVTVQAWLTFALRGTSSGLPGARIPWLLYGTGTLARGATLLSGGGFGYVGDPSVAVNQAKSYGQALSTLSALAVFGIAVAAYRFFTTKRPGDRATVVTLLGFELVVGALGGGKESFVVALLAVLIPHGAIRGKLSGRVLLVGAMLFLLIVLPFNAAYRATVRSGHGHLDPGQASASAPGIFSDVVGAESPGQVMADSADSLLHRVRMIDNVAIVAQMTPSTIPYRSPSEFAMAPVISLIPRAVWPDKPILTTGYKFSQEYYGLPSSVFTSSAITVWGDLYRHGGWAVLIVGGVIFGAGCRLFDLLFRSERDMRAIFFALTFLPIVIKSEVDLYAMIISVPVGVATALLGAHLACRSRRG